MTIVESKLRLGKVTAGNFEELDAKDYSPKRVKFKKENATTQSINGQVKVHRLINNEEINYSPVTDWGVVDAVKIERFGFCLHLDSSLHIKGNIILGSPNYKFQKGDIEVTAPPDSF